MNDIELNGIMNIFKKIENTSGKNDKVLIIRQNKDNDLFKYFLNFLYDETITTGLSDKKINKKVMMNLAIVKTFNSTRDLMNYISKNNTGRDKDILMAKKFLEDLPEEEQTFLTKVLTKSYKCGITASSVNKAIPNLIHEYKVQLAHPYAKYADKVKGEMWITTKLDGHRTLAEIYPDGRIIFRTRKGHQVLGMLDLEKELGQHLSTDKILILDGEITISDKSVSIEKVFQETSKIIRKDGIKKGLMYHVFDILPYDEFLTGESKDTYNQRRETLNKVFAESKLSPDLIELVPVLYHGNDKDVIPELMKEATSKGQEGLMINTDVRYQCKRHSGLLKVKEFFSCDGIVKDVFEGTGKYKGMLGGIFITFEDTIVKIGSGFTDEERVKYWNNPELILESVAEYQYFERTENQKGGTDLRFATWKSNVRFDKGVDDVNYE